MNVKYSVIIPVYNAELYLEECLLSLQKQSFTECEFIVWNDGSTDKSAQIIQKFVSDKRFRIFEDENRGASLARQHAVNVSKGKYILFLDSDDMVSEKMLETIDSIMDDSIDLLQYQSSENIERMRKDESFQWEVYDKTMFIEKFIKRVLIDGSEGVVLWDKVFVREILINCMKDYSYSMLEDYVFIMRYSEYVNKYCEISQVLHYYRYVENSLSKHIDPEWYQILSYVHNLKKDYMKRMKITNKIDQIHAATWFIRYTKNFILNNWYALDRSEVLKVIKSNELVEASEKLYHTEFDSKFSSYVRNKKYMAILNDMHKKAFIRKSFRRIRQCVLGR